MLGYVGQPWRILDGTVVSVSSPAQFAQLSAPGYVKVAANFTFRPEGGGTRLTTETRLRATDRLTRVRFGAYWVVIRPGSGLIRRELLAAAKRRSLVTRDRLPSGPDC